MSDLFLQPLFTWRSAVASEFGPENGTTRHVLLTLALHMNEKGESCFPSIDLLTLETAISRRAVVEHLKVASESGWIGKRALRKPNGQGWRRVEYFALIPKDVEQRFHDKQRSAPDAPAYEEEQEKGGAPSSLPQRGAPNALARRGAPGSKGGAPDSIKVVHQVHSSTSVSTSLTPKSPAARRTSLPADFKTSERVRAWAKEKGFDRYLSAHLEKFLSSVKASGRRYVDWDEAFMNCIRDDWGDVRRKELRASGTPETVSRGPLDGKTCRYCARPAMGSVGGIPYCGTDGHNSRAMDREPAPQGVPA